MDKLKNLAIIFIAQVVATIGLSGSIYYKLIENGKIPLTNELSVTSGMFWAIQSFSTVVDSSILCFIVAIVFKLIKFENKKERESVLTIYSKYSCFFIIPLLFKLSIGSLLVLFYFNFSTISGLDLITAWHYFNFAVYSIIGIITSVIILGNDKPIKEEENLGISVFNGLTIIILASINLYISIK